jgi:hypothetical protein
MRDLGMEHNVDVRLQELMKPWLCFMDSSCNMSVLLGSILNTIYCTNRIECLRFPDSELMLVLIGLHNC